MTEWIEHPDAPGWQFKLIETSNCVWRIDGHDASGRSVSHQGVDEAELLKRSIADAKELSHRQPSEGQIFGVQWIAMSQEGTPGVFFRRLACWAVDLDDAVRKARRAFAAELEKPDGPSLAGFRIFDDKRTEIFRWDRESTEAPKPMI